ncbi:MAG TPA: MarR family winged helix-turn-helix transcriptional regulator [Candidatus Acidoferrales bacterium]|nr:MarR family winged helix-turn-helix transcriptional regulator [Candidatus Acidoferrales bacterium]
MNFEQADAINEAIRAIGIRHRELAVAAMSPFGIHPGHKLILLELESAGPRTQAQLAAASGYEPPTITLSVQQLEAADLVVRRASPSDGRALIVELTDQGRALLPKLKAAWRGVAELTVAGLESTSVDELIAVLEDLAGSLAAVSAEAAEKDVPRYKPRSRLRR